MEINNTQVLYSRSDEKHSVFVQDICRLTCHNVKSLIIQDMYFNGILGVVSKQLNLLHCREEGLHHLGIFPEPYDETTDQGCYCFFQR